MNCSIICVSVLLHPCKFIEFIVSDSMEMCMVRYSFCKLVKVSIGICLFNINFDDLVHI